MTFAGLICIVRIFLFGAAATNSPVALLGKAGVGSTLRVEPPASLAGAERQCRVGAVHPARLERERTATLVSSVGRSARASHRLAVTPAGSLHGARCTALHPAETLALTEDINVEEQAQSKPGFIYHAGP